MKTVKLSTIPKCDFCGAPALYDAPTTRGPWGYMCSDCARDNARNIEIGSRIEKLDQQPNKHRIAKGIEISLLEELTVGDVRRVKCSACNEIRSMEMDAGPYLCECGVTVDIRPLI